MNQDQPPQPLYSVYRAGDRAIVCYRAVRTNPAQPVDFLSFSDVGQNFLWWDMHRAIGVSAWLDPGKAAAIGRRKGLPLVAELDLGRADERLPWAETGPPDHVTLWGPAAVLLQAVVRYVDT